MRVKKISSGMLVSEESTYKNSFGKHSWKKHSNKKKYISRGMLQPIGEVRVINYFSTDYSLPLEFL